MSDQRFPPGGSYEERISAIGKTVDERRAEVLDTVGREGGLYSKFMGTVVRFFEASWESVWTKFTGVFLWILEPFRKLITLEAFQASDEAIERSLSALNKLDMFDANDIGQLRSMMKDHRYATDALGLFVAPLVALKSFGAWLDVIAGTAIQRMNKKYSPVVPNPSEIARTSFVAPELHDRVVEAMKRSGLSQEDIELVFISKYTLQDPTQIMQLFWRGEISKPQAINRMQELGFTATRVAELMQLWERIPGMSDVIRYLGKEAFEPDMIRKFGLLEDYPRGEAEKWAAKNGYAPEWAEKEWIAHWRDIGVTPVLAGLHRGITLSNGQAVDAAFVDDYMRLIEIPPPIRDLVHKTSYNPYTRVDARRMHDMGVLKDDELVKVYEAQGYDTEHATNMALFTIRYNQRNGKDFSKADIEKGYEDGDIPMSVAYDLMKEAGFSEEYAAYLLTRVDIEKERAKRLDALEIIKSKYLNNLLTEADARNRLLGIGFNNTRVSELMDRWTLQRTVNAKLPSKTDLDKMYRHDIITEDKYKTEMTKLGYSKEYISWYLDLAKSGID